MPNPSTCKSLGTEQQCRDDGCRARHRQGMRGTPRIAVSTRSRAGSALERRDTASVPKALIADRRRAHQRNYLGRRATVIKDRWLSDQKERAASGPSLPGRTAARLVLMAFRADIARDCLIRETPPGKHARHRSGAPRRANIAGQRPSIARARHGVRESRVEVC